jgi:acyl carrier protein
MDAEREQRLTAIFRRVFHQPTLVLRDELSARDVPGWDSLNHVTLMIEVEREFGLRLRSAEVEALQCVGDLKALIERKSR